ncbi:MAG: putative lipid II flippase FtsW [Elusimicrobiota bacterium]
MKKNETRDNMDFPLLFCAAILLIIGTLMVFSSTIIMAEAKWKTPYIFVIKQVVWLSIGSAALYFFANYDYSKLQRLSKPVLIAAVLLLVAVLVIGSERGGAKRWLAWGPVSFQPSEIAKLAIVIALADYLDRKKSRLKQFKGIWPPLATVGFVCVLIGLEPDLGSPILICLTCLGLLYMAGASLKYIIGATLIFAPAAVLEIYRKPYRLERIKSFFQSWGDIRSVQYQLDQSLVALGSGGFFGKGLAKGQMKLLHVPEAHTDFIFPIIGEELGFIGSIVIIGMFLFIAWRGMQISMKSRDFFGGLLAMGITLAIVLQAMINIGVSCGIFPTKGLPLPFVSFGGTALVVNMAEIGILLNISRSCSKRV